METLKEARQQLLALREEADRLGRAQWATASCWLLIDDDTVDVFTSRPTRSPNIDASLKADGPAQRGP